MIYAEVATTIRRPRAEVAAIMFDPRFDPHWVGAEADERQPLAAPLRRGAQVRRRWRLLGWHLTALCEVTDHVPGRSVEMARRPRPDWWIRYDLEGIPEGVIARIRVKARPSGLARLLAPAVNVLLCRALVRDLDSLKDLMESGGWRKLAR